jgi:predicted metal-dependent hydrolase
MKKQENAIEKTKIYYLHKGDDIPFYIGKTIDEKDRLRKHRRKLKCDIYLEIIDEVPTNEWLFWEKYWIHTFIHWGFYLTNKRKDGGGGLSFHSLETRIKKSNSMKGRKLSPEHKQNISKGNIGKPKPKPKSFGDKMSKLLKNKPSRFKNHTHSDLTKEKIRIKLKNNKNRVGTKNSDSTRKLISLNSKGITRNNKSIIQYDENMNFIKEWPSIKEASHFIGIDSSYISNCCLDKINICPKNYIFKYKDK